MVLYNGIFQNKLSGSAILLLKWLQLLLTFYVTLLQTFYPLLVILL
uniref:Uncharacterized protein n=1 Tax=Anguilla anguilla TaxID=7936 RepID=A0A0E9V553_ANGAN